MSGSLPEKTDWISPENGYFFPVRVSPNLESQLRYRSADCERPRTGRNRPSNRSTHEDCGLPRRGVQAANWVGRDPEIDFQHRSRVGRSARRVERGRLCGQHSAQHRSDQGTVDVDKLQACKAKQPVFSNVGRGDVIKETDLVAALDDGLFSKAVLDVFVKEPLPQESPLWTPVLLTPHVAALSLPDEVANVFVKNLDLRSPCYPVDWSNGYSLETKNPRLPESLLLSPRVEPLLGEEDAKEGGHSARMAIRIDRICVKKPLGLGKN